MQGMVLQAQLTNTMLLMQEAVISLAVKDTYVYIRI